MLAKTKNKKGFTLIELLAVIVILAIIALIATPMVLKYIDKARSESAEISALTYVGELEKEVAYGQLKNKIYENRENYYVNEIPVSVKGSAPTGGIYSLKDGKVETGKFCINGYEVLYSTEGTTVTGTCNEKTFRQDGELVLSENGYGNLTHPATKIIEVLENKSNGTIICESSDTSVATCSVEKKEDKTEIKITTKGGEGTTNITVTSLGGDKFNDAKVVYVVTTEKGVLAVTANGYDGVYDGKPHGISVSASESIIKYGTSEGTYDLTESPKYTDVGEYIVYYEVTSAGYKTAYGSKVVKITKAEGNLLLGSNSGTVEYDKTKEIEIKENASNGEIKVSVAHSDIAEASIVDNKLVVKGKKTGSTIVTLSVEETKNYTSTSIEYNVEVIKANNTLTLSSSYGAYTYPNGGTFTITENKSGGSLSCKSSDTKVATCTISDNTVTVKLGTEKGTATLTIKSEETPNYNAAQAAYVVTTAEGALSINANGYSGVYDGKEHGITVSANEGATIKYGTEEGIYDRTSSPTYTNVGEYTVYYQISLVGYKTSTGSKTVVITKANGSVTVPTATTLTYNESAQELIIAGSSNTGTIEYSLDGTNYSTAIPTATEPGTYTVYYRVVGDNNHYDVEAKSLDVTIIKATLQYTSKGYEGVYDGKEYSIEVISPNGTITYGTTSTNVTLTENPKYSDVGTYTVYYKIIRPGYVDATGKETVKITQADNVLRLSATSGSYTYPTGGTFKIEENKSEGKLTCSSDKKEVADCSISGDTVTVTLGTTKGTATLTIKSAETKNYKSSQVAYVVTTASGALSVTANEYSGVYDGKEHGITVSANNGSLIKYGTSEGTYDLPNSPTYKDVGTYTVYYQVSLAGYDTAYGFKTVSISKADGTVSAPTAKSLTYNGNDQILINAGSSTTGTMYYKVGENGSYSTTLPTGKNAGEYNIYYKVLGDSNHNNVEEQSIKVIISKKAGSVSAPTAKSLTYTGSAQTLINAGSANGTGTIEYSLDGENYSEDLPTGINAKSYTVYYRVVGNSNHNDVARQSITVTIAKADNKVTLSETSGILIYPSSKTIAVTKSGGELSCKSNNEAVATCEVSGNNVKITAGTTKGSATITIKSKETDNYKEGQAAYVVTGELGKLSVNANGYEKAYDGAAHGITVSANSGATIKYGTSEGTYNLTSSPTYTDVGTYTVHYQVSLAGYDTVTGSRDVVITKANVTYTAPTAKSLTYTGSAQELIKGGTISGGTFEYSLDGTNYSSTIPTRTTAGTYTVHYKVVGDSNHNDVASQSLNVTISKATKTLTLSSSSGTHTYPTSGTIAVTNTNGGTISCSSNKTNVATCSVSGSSIIVTPGTTEGEATLTITTTETTNYYSQTATYKAIVKAGTLNVEAKGYSGTYDGNAYGITVSANSGSTIKYGTSSGTYDRTSSPTYSTAGTHTVYYQVSKAGYTTETGSQTVSIAKAKNTVTLEKTSGTLTYPTSVTINVTTTSGGPLSCKTSNSSVATCSVNNTNKTLTITPGTTAGSATITVISAATDNYNEGQAVFKVTGKLGTLSVTASDKTVTYNNNSHGITVTANSGATIKYGTSEGTYDRTSSPLYTNVGTYKIYYQVSLAGYNTVTGYKTLTINKATGSISTNPSPETLTYTGNPQTLVSPGSTATGTIYYKLGSNGTYSTSLPTATNAGTYTVYYKLVGFSNFTDVAEASVNVTIGYASGSISTHPSKKTLTYTGSAQTLITAGSSSTGSMRYKVGSNGTYSSSLPTATAVGTYTVYYYSSGDANHYSSSTYSIDVTISKASGSITTAPVGKSLTYTGSSQTLISAGSSSTGTMYYKLSTASSYSTSLPTASAVGTYTIQYYAASSTNYNSTSVSTVTATIGKASGKITTSPTAKTLTYTGSAQTLINAGSSSTGTMYYKLSTASSYSTSLPTATNAGTYTVYYYAGSSTNYNSTSTYSLTVTISKASGSYTTRPTGKTVAYTGSSLTLVNAGSTSTGTIYYKLGSSGTYSTSLPTASALGTYTIYYKITGNSNYNDVAESTLTSYIKTNFAINAKVGDYVSMTPSLSSFTTSTSYTGYSSTQTIYPSELKLWRIIKINSSGTVEMISEYVSSTAVYFKGKTGFKNFVGYLNVLASKYTNSSYTTSSRHMGYSNQTLYLTNTSNSIDSTSLTPPWTSETGSSTVESQGGGDWGWSSEVQLLNNTLGTFFAKGVDTPSTNQTYWMSGRYYGYYTDHWDYNGRYVSTSGGHSSTVFYSYGENTDYTGERAHRLRPVVTLKSGLNPSGSGTSSSPWKLN